MRIRIDFGTTGTRREVTWNHPLEDFPTAIIFNNERWEWFMYQDDPNKQYDKILIFNHMFPGDNRWYHCVDFDIQFGYSSITGCQCGSAYSWASQFHMFCCPMWRKE